VLYEGPREDDLYVMDVANALLETAVDSNLATRVRASWALGNLCDAFVLKRVRGDQQLIPDNLVTRLLTASLKAAKDNEKVKPNAMRALGGLARCLSAAFIQKEQGQQVISAISEALCTNLATGPVKVRWNAAHALGNLFNNKQLPIGSAQWAIDAAQSLLSAVRTAANFKVRINAASAFAIPTHRPSYGNNMCRSFGGDRYHARFFRV